MRKTELYIIGIVILIVAGFLIISNTLSGKIITMTGQTAKKIKNCSEDDFGNNKFLKGTVSQSIYGNAKAYTDYCVNDSTKIALRRLVEFYCLYDSVKSKRYWCEDGCEDGACINSTARKLAKEVSSCREDDRVIDYYKKGETCTDKECKKDFCTDKNHVSEFYCSPEGISQKLYNCPSGCKEGACL